MEFLNISTSFHKSKRKYGEDRIMELQFRESFVERAIREQLEDYWKLLVAIGNYWGTSGEIIGNQ